MKNYERMFRSRVPLPEQAYAKITFTDPWSYAELGEAVEAWGFRLHAARARASSTGPRSPGRWYAEEFTPGRAHAARRRA